MDAPTEPFNQRASVPLIPMTNDDQIRVHLSCGQNYLLGRIAVFDVRSLPRIQRPAGVFTPASSTDCDYKPLIVGNKRHPFDDKHVLGRVYDREKTNRRTGHATPNSLT